MGKPFQFPWIWINFLFLLFVLAAGLIVAVTFVANESERTSRERGMADLAFQIDQVRHGQTRSVYLYDTKGTDCLLAELEDIEGVESLRLELTDVTDDCIEHLRNMPDLKVLVVYGGYHGLSDTGLRHLSGCGKLEDLSLVNTRVTNSGLEALQEFPSLQSLTLCNDFGGGRASYFTDEAVNPLSALTRLKTLRLSGTWYSEHLKTQLKRALPNCRVSASDNWRTANK
jgi:hypothetical protein